MKKVFKTFGFFFIVMAACMSVTLAYAEDYGYEDADKTFAPYFLIEGKAASVETFPLKETDVLTNINGVIADTYVVQTYANEGKKAINAVYVFPASTKASVHGMQIRIGDRIVTAKIKEKEEAATEFEQAKSEGKSAALLEQQRPNMFTMNVANIMPGDTVQIELHYTEVISPTDGTYQFVFPTVVGPRYADSTNENDIVIPQWLVMPYLKKDIPPPMKKYNITVNMSTGVPISDLVCDSHDVKVVWDSKSAAQITLSDNADFAGDRDFILEYRLTGQELRIGVMLKSGIEENFFMLTIQPPERYEPEEILPREYIFVLDVSGSMYGYPLNTAKELIRGLVGGLKETDIFNLVLFSGGSTLMSPKSVAATEKNTNKATTLIYWEGEGGGTELAPALETAIAIPSDKDYLRSIVIITDGYISGEKDIFDIISKNLSTTNFFSFGIGNSVNRYLIEGIAKVGLGEAFIVTEESEANRMAQRFSTYIQSPVLSDISISYEGLDVYDVEPTCIPTLFAQRPIVLYGKWRGEPKGSITVTGKTGSKDYKQTIQLTEEMSHKYNSAIDLLWARSRVERLTDFYTGDNIEAAKKEVTEIGLKYSMLTPYTSFIAVVEETRNKDKDSIDVNQPLPLPEKVSEYAIDVGYMIGSEPNDAIITAIALLAIMASISHRILRTAKRGAI